jgi:hypothetical protein
MDGDEMALGGLMLLKSRNQEQAKHSKILKRKKGSLKQKNANSTHKLDLGVNSSPKIEIPRITCFQIACLVFLSLQINRSLLFVRSLSNFMMLQITSHVIANQQSSKFKSEYLF